MKFRLFKKRTVWWWPTWQALALVLVALVSAAWTASATLHPFLARTQKVDANLLVVEGWIAEQSLPRVVEEFAKGDYDKVCVTGGPIPRGRRFTPFETFADLTAANLKLDGISDDKLVTAPAPYVPRQRTHKSAVTLREKLASLGVEARGLNVFTEDFHARRTQVVFQKVFGDDVSIGVIAVPTNSYDPKRWWATSEGLKGVTMESIAFLYEWIADSGR